MFVGCNAGKGTQAPKIKEKFNCCHLVSQFIEPLALVPCHAGLPDLGAFLLTRGMCLPLLL
jgi:hypothetical protein